MRLVELSMERAERSRHPGIKTDGTQYLVKIHGQWFAGTFGEVWFGLNFYPAWGTPRQFDAPGHNGSEWDGIYEIWEGDQTLTREEQRRLRIEAAEEDIEEVIYPGSRRVEL